MIPDIYTLFLDDCNVCIPFLFLFTWQKLNKGFASQLV